MIFLFGEVFFTVLKTDYEDSLLSPLKGGNNIRIP